MTPSASAGADGGPSDRQSSLAGAQDKLAFLLALVPYVLELGTVTVAEAASHFRVSEEQIRSAIRLIAVSGVPGETQSYQHGDLFDIDWDDFELHDTIAITHPVAIDDSPRLSAREAAALIAGLQYLQAVPSAVDSSAAASLAAKLATGASERPSQVAIARDDADQAIAIVQRAVEAGVAVAFDYVDAAGAKQRRTVDPLRIDSSDEDWYLRGWDHLRGAVRTFRLDRIRDLEPTKTLTRYRPDELTLPERLFDGVDQAVNAVTLMVPAHVAPLLGEYLDDGGSGAASEVGGLVQVRVAHLHGLKRIVASMGGLVTLVDPGDAAAVVRDWAFAGLAAYDAVDRADDAGPRTDRLP